MNVPKRKMFCRDHGEAEACQVCVHIYKGAARGFHEGTGPLHNAWCDRCDFFRRMPGPVPDLHAFIAGGEMMVCEYCFELARIANERT